MPRVLIVDDEPTIVMAVRDELTFEGLDVKSAADGPSGLATALEWRPDVVLLDLMLPGMNGLEVCRKLRPAASDVWIIMITARGQEVDRVTGFDAGADDYVVKPFSLRELVARVRVGLRRRSRRENRQNFTAGSLAIDLPSRKVTKDGNVVPLTRKEFEILAVLAKRGGDVVPRDELCDLIWGPDIFITHRVIDTHIAALRKKIESEDDTTGRIVSVRGVGYKLE